MTPATIWLTGLPSAGKTTLARGLRGALVARGQRVTLLDGDEIRATIAADLGFTRADRGEQARRVAQRCLMLREEGTTPIVALVSPYRADRAAARALLAPGFAEVFVDAPISTCQARDVKGLYARAQAGTLSRMTGVDDPYEVPLDPDIHIRTDRDDVAVSVAVLESMLLQLGHLTA